MNPLEDRRKAALDYHEFESGHYISDFNVGVLDQWLRRRLATK